MLINKHHAPSHPGVDAAADREHYATLQALRAESDMRVRKCFKLTAFYYQLFLSSNDKHLVHHLTVQLELAGEWTTKAVQCVGMAGGPTSSEFEVTDQELDWIVQGLELACFFTPVAGDRLVQLVALLKQHRPNARIPVSASVSPLQQRDPPTTHETSKPDQARFAYDHDPHTHADIGLDNPQDPSEAVYTSPFLFDEYGYITDRDPATANYGHLSAVNSDFAQVAPLNSANAFQGDSWMTGLDATLAMGFDDNMASENDPNQGASINSMGDLAWKGFQ